jgi:alpha-mannosidase
MQAPDITKTPTLYVVPYAHLDTQWRWEFPQSISEYLLKTMRVNFDYIEKYPHYVFNWTGANRYRLMKEYYPQDYEKIKKYVAAGRWFPAGSSMEEGDVNLPTAEGIIRQILYGNTYFRKEFGKASAEYMLPDCFGFPAALPSILAHAGVKGFSTQKLSAAWQPAPRVGGPDSPEKTPDGIPFNVGIWEGPDGKTIIAALNPGSYGSDAWSDLSQEPPPTPPGGRGGEQDWVKRIQLDGQVTGVFADYHYVGTGDTGGAARESTAKLLEAIVTHSETVLPVQGGRGGRGQNPAPPPQPGPPVKVGNGPVHVVIATADQMFNDIKPEMTGRMPRYKGDLELINHSAGSLTSEAIHKRWIRRNEILADAAEKASVAADWLGGRRYPLDRLNNAWTLVMGGHFHDTGAGTATPRSYEFAWNDDLIALNQFADVLTDAAGSVASAMDTQGPGQAVVVYNPLNIEREDVVEATVAHPANMVTGPDGRSVASQVEGNKVVFVAKMPPVGYAVYHVGPAAAASTGTLKVTAQSLENERYRVSIDRNGDVSSIFDKSVGKELLAAPVRLALSTDAPRQWPAWNMDWDQVHAAPRGFVGGPAKVHIAENGPARVAVEISRDAEGSHFVTTVRLSAGAAGDRVEFLNAIDWRGLATNVKATFALTAANENATYNQEIGTIQRPNENERQFEVGTHQWIDLTDKSGAFGVTLLTDSKNGSDKPDDHTLRLTLLRTPGFPPPPPGQPVGRGGRAYSDQLNQDWGHHEFVFGIAGHKGDWRAAQTDWTGHRLNEPLLAFVSPSHAGALGKQFSLVTVSNPRVRIMALKRAELSDEVVLRMVELDGKPADNVRVKFAGPIAAAREINGQELPLGPATVDGGSLATSFTAYQPRTFALKLGAASSKATPVESQAVALTYDLAVASNDDTRSVGGFDDRGNAMPAEMLPETLTIHDVTFHLAPAATGKANAVVAKGQSIDLPAGRFNRVYVLAAAEGDQPATFRTGDQQRQVTVQNWGGFIGQWDTRIWNIDRDWAVSADHAVWPPAETPAGRGGGGARSEPRYPEDYVGLRPGFLKPATLAWYASHHHTAAGLNEPYQYSYLFVYALDLPAGAHRLTLPANEKIRVLAVSVAAQNPAVAPAHELYDTLPEPSAVVR